MLDKYFDYRKHKTDFKTEVIAGVSTFLTMAYIMFLNPVILADGGFDFGGVFTATALAGHTVNWYLSATGGTEPYSGTGSFTVSAGAYTYTVTDANGCTSTTTGSVSEPTALSASSSASRGFI